MADLAEQDYFTDASILTDPYRYFEAARAVGPVYRSPRGYLVVTGFDETLEVIRNTADFSTIVAVQGAGMALPFVPEGPDIAAQIEAHRGDFVGGDLLVGYDDRQHLASRSLLMKLFTPSRLKASEAFIADYSARMVKQAVADGGVELMKAIATPFVTMVIADLLGVPEGDRQLFMDAIEAGPPPGSVDPGDLAAQNQPLVIMGTYFVDYVHDRRANPRDDVLSEMANATYPDGTVPDAMEIVRLATFLFGAGQDTSAKLLGNAIRAIVDEPGLQDRLRADPSLIPAFIEEMLRLEGSVKVSARLARRDTRIGGLAVPAGTRVMIAFAAANRDPRRWEDPGALILDRPRIKEHLAFSRGAHVCAGAPLARVEVRALLEDLLRHTSRIGLDEERHGRAGARTLDYEASFIIRGLAELHLKLTPAPGFVHDTAPVARPAPRPEPEAAPKRGLLARLLGRGEPAAAPARYSTGGSRLGDLLADPAARAVLDRHFPGMSADKRIGMGKGMTLRTVQKFAPDFFTPEALDAADAELATLKPR